MYDRADRVSLAATCKTLGRMQKMEAGMHNIQLSQRDVSVRLGGQSHATEVDHPWMEAMMSIAIVIPVVPMIVDRARIPACLDAGNRFVRGIWQSMVVHTAAR